LVQNPELKAFFSAFLTILPPDGEGSFL